jgi:tetratricopeptide (TPR) repeat protein
MRKSLLATAVSITALSVSSSQLVVAQTDLDQQFGTVQFETSCNEVAQRRFNRAMRYQHSFWYEQANEIFEETAKADPSCAIAYWGVALTLVNNPHIAIPSANLAPGLAAIQKAKAMNAKTERERDYIDALAFMYLDHDKLTHRQRIGAYLKAMEALAAKYPNDDEAQIAYAITLNTSAAPTDKTYAQQTKGAALLEPMSKRLPQHPGVTHYLIHLYDYPETAEKGLEAANRYAKIAPAAPHAQHMPSHIYTRVGYWKESIASNTLAAKAARADKEAANQLHGQDYMVYAHLQLGQDKSARTVMDDMASTKNVGPGAFPSQFGLAASEARYMVEPNYKRGRVHSIRQWRSRISRAPSGQRALAGRTPQRPISPSLSSCATSCARPRTPIGRRSSTFSARSRPHGCSRPRARTTMPSRR